MTYDNEIDDWTARQIKAMPHLPTTINFNFARLLAHQWNAPAAREHFLARARKEAEREPRSYKRQEPRWNSRGWIVRFVDAGTKKVAVVEEVVKADFFHSVDVSQPSDLLSWGKKREAAAREFVEGKLWHAGREGFSEGEVYDLIERFAKLEAKVETLGFDSAFEAAVFMALDQILSPEAQRQSQDQQQSAYIETIAELFSRDLLEQPYTDEELERVIAYMQGRRKQFMLGKSATKVKSQGTRSIPSIDARER